jgi:hypothetical protein
MGGHSHGGVAHGAERGDVLFDIGAGGADDRHGFVAVDFCAAMAGHMLDDAGDAAIT